MNGKKWIRFGMLLAALMAYAAAAFFCNSAKADADRTYIVLSRGIDAIAAEEIFAQEKNLDDSVGFCFWGEAGEKTVRCKETGGMAQVTQVLLSGNPELMGAGALAWQNGCFLDAAAARKLFGTSRCAGQALWQDDVPYRVFGTISALQPTMLAGAAEKDGDILDRCVLAVPAEEGAAIAGQFLLRWGLQGETVDFYPLWTVTHNLLLILPCILLLAALAHGVKAIRGMPFPEGFSRAQMLLLMKPAFLLFAGACLLCLLGSRIVILRDMIPTRWSDFSFWGNWWETQKENVRRIVMTPMGNTALQMVINMVKSMGCSIAGFLLSLWAFKESISPQGGLPSSRL